MSRHDPFFETLRAEMAVRARMILAGGHRGKAGQLLPEDLVQESLAKLISSYGEAALRERPHGQRMALAYRAMRNLAIDDGRRKGAYLQSANDEHSPQRQVADEGPGVHETAAARERAVRLHAALAELSPEEQCFITQVMKTDSVPEATAICGWPPKSPYYVLKQLFGRLRTTLAALGPGEPERA